MRKNIVMYFRKRPLSHDPFATFGTKRSVYHGFFQQGVLRGFNMFIASREENYRSPLLFRNAFIYNSDRFEPYKQDVYADAIFDRSGGLRFPPKEIGSKVLNCIEFKQLCNDKNAQKKILGKYMPKSFRIRTQGDLSACIKKFNRMSKIVLKPARGMQGKGILIDTPSKIAQFHIEDGSEYTLQEFIDTSLGIPKIANSHHDLRIVVVDGEIVLSHIREPKRGSLLANVAQGGSIREVPLDALPQFIQKATREMQSLLDKEYDFPLYSIDFGIQDKTTPFVFELNDQIGFPTEAMVGSELFIQKVLASLEKRAQRNGPENMIELCSH